MAVQKDPAQRRKPGLRPVRLLRPFSFIDEAGVRRSWRVDEVVRDGADIALLHGRGAPIEKV
jgi:hypothetical protein